MFDRLERVEDRYEELSELMAQPEVLSDHVRLQQVAREQREMEAVVNAYRQYRTINSRLRTQSRCLTMVLMMKCAS